MRSEFVAQIKTYIESQPDNDNGLAKIKEYVREIHASEEEFTEALRQVVYESMGKKAPPNTEQAAEQPHALAVRPEHELEERHVTLEERPEHEIVEREEQTTPTQTSTGKPSVTSHEKTDLDTLKEEIRKDDKEQLTAFQKELADTKETLLSMFETEMEKQRNAIRSNHEEYERQTNHNHTRTIGTAAVLGIVFLLFGGMVGLFISSSIHKPQESNPIVSTSTLSNNSGFVSQVYASTQVVDPIKVFSFPPTNISLVEAGIPKKEVVGFFPYWMLPVEEKISLNNLTSLSLFGLDMDGKGNIIAVDASGQPNGGWEMYNDPKLTQLLSRAKQQNLHVFYTLKMFDSTNIENLVRSNDAEKTFISNALHLVSTKNLKGINLDFEYIGDPPADVRDGFTRLVQNLSSALKSQMPGSELTVDTYITAAADQKLIDISAVAQAADALIVMGYDIHTPTGDPGAVAPMESEVGIVGLMQSYLDKVSPDKLILAVPYYGYDWTIPKAPSSTKSIVTYAQVIDQSKTVPLEWDNSSQSPYYTYRDTTTNTSHEVHFDNTRSLGIKYDFVNQKNLQGVGIWALGYDGKNTDLESLLIEKFGR